PCGPPPGLADCQRDCAWYWLGRRDPERHPGKTRQDSRQSRGVLSRLVAHRLFDPFDDILALSSAVSSARGPSLVFRDPVIRSGRSGSRC
ncbi:MAG: hypothetical protein M1358_15650, partial [Chloroflexi bacterium]|nr:hypothetical protein [Chloroflexota bacterium]